MAPIIAIIFFFLKELKTTKEKCIKKNYIKKKLIIMGPIDKIQ